MNVDKRVLNFLVIILLSLATFWWTFFIFHMPFDAKIVASVILIRMLASFLIFQDYSLSWSKASQKTFLIKSFVYLVAFFVYIPLFYGVIAIYFFASELFLYIFSINFAMYVYYFVMNRSKVEKTKSIVIYGAGKAGIKLESEFSNSQYRVKYFIDDDKIIQNRSIDSIKVISPQKLQESLGTSKLDLLVIAMPSAPKPRIKEIYRGLSHCFKEIKILPSINDILRDRDFATQLQNISLEDLLARHPQDLDKEKIKAFIKDKTVLITGAGGSIGSEICRQCEKFGAKKLILLDHSEYNLYAISEEIRSVPTVLVMQSVVEKELLENTFQIHMPEIVIHAAAYKHVPLVESNMHEAIVNNVLGTKNVIDSAIKYGVQKFVMLSTDKAVRPTNVMGATKRICELYVQNVLSQKTEIVAVRFGNVLGSSGSVIPKFKSQIERGENLTVTHPDITRYFMLIPEACELVLQAGAIGRGGEIFILDMGEPVKIVDLARKMIELSASEGVDIEFTGLRQGEKLYEELLIDESDAKTEYDSIMVATPTYYSIDKLNDDIQELLACGNKLEQLKVIVPEFYHRKNEV